MKKIGGILFLAMFTWLLAGCMAPAANTGNSSMVNSNANTKPTATAPTADAFLDMEKKANEAYAKGDGAYFDGMLSDKAVMSMGKDQTGKAGIVEMIKKAKCDNYQVKLSEPQMSKVNDDTYAFIYKNESTGKCNEGKDGAMVDAKPVRAATVWVRNGEKWQAVWHGENEIMAAPPAGGDKSGEAKPANKPAAPAANAKKEDKPASNTASNSAAPAPAKLTASPNTDALTKAHAAGWEAFRNKDAKWFEDHVASSFTGVDPAGAVYASKAAAIKEWTGTGTMKCEGITKTSFTDGFAQSISPTVEILFGKGNADGKCDAHPNGDLWQTAIYVKEGDAWKLAFMVESMPMPGM